MAGTVRTITPNGTQYDYDPEMSTMQDGGSWTARNSNNALVYYSPNGNRRYVKLYVSPIQDGKSVHFKTPILQYFKFFKCNTELTTTNSYTTARAKVLSSATQLTIDQLQTGFNFTVDYENVVDDEDTTKIKTQFSFTPIEDDIYFYYILLDCNPVCEEVSDTKFTFTSELTNCSCNIEDNTRFTDGTEITVTVTLDENCIWGDTPTLSNGIEMTLVDGVYTATFEITADVELTATATKITSGALNKDVTNATFEIFDKDSNNISDNTTWNTTQTPLTFTVKANNGYYFETAPRVSYFDSTYQQLVQYLSLNEETGKYEATITPYKSTVKLTATAAADTSIHNKYGVITVYVPTYDDLKEIARERYFYETDEYSSRYYKDLGDFISKLHVLPLEFSGLRTQKLCLGNYTVSVNEIPVIDENTYTISMGSVKVEGLYNNVVDYKATVKLYLPFIGYRDLAAEKVMDKTIHVSYKIDVITGNAKVFVTADDTIIETYDCTLGYTIPFVGITNIEKSFTLNANYLWGYEAFITVDFPMVTGDNNTYGNATNTGGLIGSFTGLTSFEDITLITTATETERNEIVSLLEKGVIL